MADKIDQLKIGSTSYDIDLPPDATPSIASLTLSSNLTMTGGATGSSNGITVDNVNGYIKVVDGSHEIGFKRSDGSVEMFSKEGDSVAAFALPATSGTLVTDAHTHSTSITTASSGATTDITLTSGSKYKLTTGGTDTVFQMPNKQACYKHDIKITDSSTNYVYCFTLYSLSDTAMTFKTAMTNLYGGLAAWNTSSVPLTIVTTTWESAISYFRHVLKEVTTTGTGFNIKYTLKIGPCEAGIKYDGTQMLLTLDTASKTINENNATVSDTVTVMDLQLM